MKTKIYQTLFQKIKIPTYFNSVKLDHQGGKKLENSNLSWRYTNILINKLAIKFNIIILMMGELKEYSF